MNCRFVCAAYQSSAVRPPSRSLHLFIPLTDRISLSLSPLLFSACCVDFVVQRFGQLEEFHVVGNLGEHMLGNVYLKYSSEEEAERALKALNGRWYAGRQLTVEYSPVSDFRESRCRQYDEETCNRSNFCNFIHMRPLPSVIRKELDRIRSRARRRRSRSRSRSRSRDRDRDRDRRRDGDRDRDRDRRRGDDRSDRRSSRDRDYNRDRDRDHNRPPTVATAAAVDAQPAATSGRSASEERRAKIAEWNKARDAKKNEESRT